MTQVDDKQDAVAEARRCAIAAMRAPSAMHIICIDVTNKCDLNCSNCTRLLVNQDRYWDMTPQNFRLALRSLADFPGTIAMIGGNPCMHPKFEELCQIFVEEIPEPERRGLWTNNVFKHAALAEKTFGVFNLNPHGAAAGIKSLAPLKDKGWYYEGHSDHASILAAIKDLYEPVEMWERIGRCDINQNWSASIVQQRGELRAYFCEVAASFDLARRGDHGLPVVPGWWKQLIASFCGQIDAFCPGCGVAAKVKGHMDHEETDTYSASNADIAQKAASGRRKRKMVEVDATSFEAVPEERPVTLYSENMHIAGPTIYVVTPYFQESEAVLGRCMDSVRLQAVAAKVVHVMVADGHPSPAVAAADVRHVVLPQAHGDNGNVARGLGAMLANSEGAEFVAYLDADNWFYPDHLAAMLDLHRQTGAQIACSWRHFYDPAGTLLNMHEVDEVNLTHVDTSCLFVHASAADTARLWIDMPRRLSPICDRIFLAGLRHRNCTAAFLQRPTVGFTSVYAEHYRGLGLPLPEGAKEPSVIHEPVAWLNTAEGVRETVARLGFWPG